MVLNLQKFELTIGLTCFLFRHTLSGLPTMARTKPKSRKGPTPHIAEASPKKRRKGAEPTGGTTLPAINKVKERAKQ
jgi:hypothetical protein